MGNQCRFKSCLSHLLMRKGLRTTPRVLFSCFFRPLSSEAGIPLRRIVGCIMNLGRHRNVAGQGMWSGRRANVHARHHVIISKSTTGATGFSDVTAKFMPLDLKQVVPWGRSLEEYCRMFDLRDGDLALSILCSGHGPAAFKYTTRPGRTSRFLRSPLSPFGSSDRGTHRSLLRQLWITRKSRIGTIRQEYECTARE